MRVIHCIGDSHASFFGGRDRIYAKITHPAVKEPDSLLIPCFKAYRVGSSLAYNLCKHNSTTRGREFVLELLDKDIPAGSRLLFCFGSIDCNNHLAGQAKKQNRNIESVAGECAERYLRFVREVRDKGFEVAVWGVNPKANFPPGLEREEYLKRNYVTKCFNTSLGEMLADTDIKFISIFDEVVDEEGITMDRYLMDVGHLSQEAMPIAIEEFKRHYPDLSEVTLPKLYKLHVGGTRPKTGWKIMNRSGGQGIDFTGGLTELGGFADNSIDEMYISNELEYLDPLTEIEPAIKDIYRVLKVGGVCGISVPDIMLLARFITEPTLGLQEQGAVIGLIYGFNTGTQKSIKVGFTADLLKGVLAKAGFIYAQVNYQYTYFKEESFKQVFGNNIMLNLQATKY